MSARLSQTHPKLPVPDRPGDPDYATLYVADDDPVFAAHITEALQAAGHAAIAVGNSEELRQRIAQEPVDCILLEYALAGENGLEIFSRLQRKLQPMPAVIMVGETKDPHAIIKAFRLGIDDFVLKPGLQVSELITAINRAVQRKREERDRVAELDRMKRLTTLDSLTGFYTRRELEGKLIRLAETANRTQKRFAVVACSINEYQFIADKFGIVMADRVLRMAAQNLRTVIREGDFCGRYDDALFVQVVQSSPDAIEKIARRVKEALTFEFRAEAVRIQITASIGTATYPFDGDVPGEIIESAVAAMGASAPPPMPRTRAEAAAEAAEPAAGERTLPVAAPTMLTEHEQRRRHRRQRVLKAGLIILNDGYSTIDCVIRDLSESGARVMISARFAAPPFFELQIKEEGTRRKVARRWQIDAEIGVEYLPDSAKP